MLPTKVDRMQFTDLDSYQRIWRWMGECSDTHQQAGEVLFETPNMRWPGQVARPGDWIVRTPTGFVAYPQVYLGEVTTYDLLAELNARMHVDKVIREADKFQLALEAVTSLCMGHMTPKVLDYRTVDE